MLPNSNSVRRKAIEVAEMEVLDRRLVTIPAADWEKFGAWADAPAKDNPALRKLAASLSAWEAKYGGTLLCLRGIPHKASAWAKILPP